MEKDIINSEVNESQSLTNNKDNKIIEKDKKDKSKELLIEKHLSYLINLDNTKDADAIGYYTNEYLKMGALYWGVGAVYTLNSVEKLKKQEIIDFVLACQRESGGFGGYINHDETMTSTHYAVLVLLQLDSINLINKQKIIQYVLSLMGKDGSFKLDKYGEADTRFSYCAVSCLKLLGAEEELKSIIKKSTEYVLACQNFDGGFGGVPGAESHAAYTFCAIGFLGVTNQLSLIDEDRTCMWLAARQTHLGGFNGRPEKLADVCYSWWVLSCFYMMKRQDFIDLKLLEKFILECQDEEDGGFADRPGNCNDVFHTFFGVAALSLMNTSIYGSGEKGLTKINPFFAIPYEVLNRIGVKHFSLENLQS
jgi:geranylgeranyl transferase type-2 subunit beta